MNLFNAKIKKYGTRLLVGFLLVAATESVIANPRVTAVFPLGDQSSVREGSPVGISVVFSEPVYGFTSQDIVTNGGILAIEGSNAYYKVLIVPNTWPIILDILTDSVFNFRGQGNDPFPQPVVVSQSGQVLAFTGSAVTTKKQPPSQPEPQQTRREVYTGSTEFVMDLGAYGQGPAFFHLNDQTDDAKSRSTAEITLGLEVRRGYKGWRPGLGYKLMAGYQQTLYTDTSTYTAVPLLGSLNFYFNNYVSLGVGMTAHVAGQYTHKGILELDPPLPPGEGRAFTPGRTFNVAPGANGLDANLPGVFVDLTLLYKHVGLVLRYLNLSLHSFENPLAREDFEGNLRNAPSPSYGYSTNNGIDTFGVFIQFRG